MGGSSVAKNDTIAGLVVQGSHAMLQLDAPTAESSGGASGTGAIPQKKSQKPLALLRRVASEDPRFTTAASLRRLIEVPDVDFTLTGQQQLPPGLAERLKAGEQMPHKKLHVVDDGSRDASAPESRMAMTDGFPRVHPSAPKGATSAKMRLCPGNAVTSARRLLDCQFSLGVLAPSSPSAAQGHPTVSSPMASLCIGNAAPGAADGKARTNSLPQIMQLQRTSSGLGGSVGGSTGSRWHQVNEGHAAGEPDQGLMVGHVPGRSVSQGQVVPQQWRRMQRRSHSLATDYHSRQKHLSS